MKSSKSKLHRKVSTLVTSAFASALILQTASGDDIETLVGLVSPEDVAGPNITLIVDTSGSMGGEVIIDLDLYDSAVDYTGPWDIYESNGQAQRYFFTPPGANQINIPDENDTGITTWISSDAFVCAEALAIMSTTGYYTDIFAQFYADREANTGFWTFPSAAGGNPLIEQSVVECFADFGVHGDGSGNGSYPIDLDTLPASTENLFPWSPDADAANVISWQNTGGRFTFYSPNFLNWVYTESQINGTPVISTRIEVVKDVMTELIGELRANSADFNDGLRMGLMRFDQNGSGGMVIAPTEPIVDNADALIDQIATLEADGNTPLAETMYEAYRYYTGDPVFFGNNTFPEDAPAASTNGIYNSPIIASCQKNYIVLLTDGQPVNDNQANTDISAIAGQCGDNGDSCLDDMSNYMHTNDVSDQFDDDQTVDTFVIGFFTDFDLLEDTATGVITTQDENGNDITSSGYILASNRDQLKEAFRLFVGEAMSDVSSFSAPAVSVNSLNRLTNRDTLYFTMFTPAQQGEPHWDGNLKAYRIGRENGSGDIQILGANGEAAVNSDGTFKSDAISIWSATADGGVVEEGGMASRLSANRNIYSNLSTSPSLSADSNRVSIDNATAISAAANIPEGDELNELIAFANGLDGDGQSRRVMGDPLHSQPLVVNFTSNGGNEDLLLVFGTNDGYLHVVNPVSAEDDTSSDLEQFAFIPRELIGQLPRLKENQQSNFRIENKAYGMDGPISGWIKGDNGNLIVDSGESLFVYAGMRRGGRSYYALDLTNRSNPKLQFVISPERAGYSNLGQSWSRLSQGRIRIGGTDKDVLIFGGGYDENQDNSNTADTMGNSVYIADAETGQLLWSAGGSDTGADLELPAMTHSIPSNVRILDINQDGYIDRLYVGDMGAQVWRFDIDNFSESTAAAVTGGLFADLGTTGVANERRFYSPPSVARFIDAGQAFLTVSLGSGYRAHPLNTSNDDRLYVLRDDNVFSPALNSNGVPEYADTNADLLITEADLIALDRTLITTEGYDGIQEGQFGKGWFFELGATGEKSLSPALTVDGRVFFSSYIPSTPELTCEPKTFSGRGSLYGIDIMTGLPALYDDSDDGPPLLDRELGPTGIPPEPKLIFVAPNCEDCSDGQMPNSSELVIQTGSDTDDNQRLFSNPARTYWLNYDAE